MRSPGRSAALLAAVTVALSLGSSPSPLGGDLPEPPSDPGTLVFQLHLWESLTGPVERSELPEFSLYGGGRVIVGAGWEGTLLRAREFTLDPGDYRRVYHLAYAAGLARARHLPEPSMTTDGTLLVAELRAGERLLTTTAVSLGRQDETGARLRLTELRREIKKFVVPDEETSYRPGRVAVLSTGGYSTGRTEPPRPWPYGDPADGTDTVLGVCTVHDGAEAADIQELASTTGQDARWLHRRAETQEVLVLVRPLLPEEAGCADLGHPVR